MDINAAGLEDIETIRHIACLTWPVAYAQILSAGQLNYMLTKMYGRDQLLSQMNESDQAFFISSNNGNPTGFVNVGKVNYQVPGETPKNEVWKLHKLYVLPSEQKSGAGKQLLEKAVENIKSNNGTYLVLNVNRDNSVYHYYLKQGFEVLESGDFDIGSGFYMNDFIMGKSL